MSTQTTEAQKIAFVTGGSGFLGRHLIPALCARGYAVRALARSARAADTVRAAGAEPVPGDLGDVAALTAGMAGADVVFHAAAHVEQGGTRAEFYEANVAGTERVLAAARAAGVGRLCHVSTEAVLVGGGPIVDADETRPRPAHPIGLYPETKGLAEARVLGAVAAGLSAVIVRPRLIWGRGDTTLLPVLCEAVRKGRYAWIGGGRYLTSTCHVRNVAEGAILAAERGGAGEIYFLTDGPKVEFRRFVGDLIRTQGLDPGERELGRPLATALATVAELLWRALPLPGEPPLTRTALKLAGEEVTVNDTKARRELGYAPVVTIEEGLAEMSAGRGGAG